MECRLLLVRHGETDWNKEKKLQGVSDNPLNENGKKHARLVAEKILADKQKPVIIYSSPLARARQTAEIFSGRLETPIIYNDDLKEVNFGSLEGLTWEDAKRKTGKDLESGHDAFKFDYILYGGESAQQAISRINNFEKFLDSNPELFGKTAIIISHGTIIKLLLKEKTGKSFEGGFIWPATYFPVEIT